MWIDAGILCMCVSLCKHFYSALFTINFLFISYVTCSDTCTKSTKDLQKILFPLFSESLT